MTEPGRERLAAPHPLATRHPLATVAGVAGWRDAAAVDAVLAPTATPSVLAPQGRGLGGDALALAGALDGALRVVDVSGAAARAAAAWASIAARGARSWPLRPRVALRARRHVTDRRPPAPIDDSSPLPAPRPTLGASIP